MNYKALLSLCMLCTTTSIFAQFEKIQDITIGHFSSFRNHQLVDIELDGDLDYYYTDRSFYPNGVLFLNNGDGLYGDSVLIQVPEVSSTLTTTTAEVIFADMNGDGYPDLVYEYSNSRIKALVNQGNGTFSGTLDFGYIASYNRVFHIADMDNDGDNDLLLSTHPIPFEDRWLIRENDGTGVFGNDYFVEEDSPILDIGDLNNDGFNDLLFKGKNSTDMAWLENPGNLADWDNSTRIVLGDYNIFARARIVDLDNDLDNDILFSHNTSVANNSNKIYGIQNLGGGSFAATTALSNDINGFL